MPTLTFTQLAEMIGGTVIQGGDVTCSTVVIDSREVKPDSVFFAIKGERLDGHQFLPQALADGTRRASSRSVPANVDRRRQRHRAASPTPPSRCRRLARSIRERYHFTARSASPARRGRPRRKR